MSFYFVPIQHQNQQNQKFVSQATFLMYLSVCRRISKVELLHNKPNTVFAFSVISSVTSIRDFSSHFSFFFHARFQLQSLDTNFYIRKKNVIFASWVGPKNTFEQKKSAKSKLIKTRAITVEIFASCKLSVEKGHHSSQSVENSIWEKYLEFCILFFGLT